MRNLSSLLGGGMLLKQQLITADTTWARPARMAGDTVWITLIGGGSSGTFGAGTTSRGGNGGQYRLQVPVSIGSATSVACTIGAGGGATMTATANAGLPTSFGSFLSVLGGSAPPAAPNPFGSYGGQGKASGAVDQFSNGSDTPLGYGGRVTSASLNLAGGGGGLGLGSSPPTGGSAGGLTGAQGYGAGGGGSNLGSTPGAPGCILIEWPEFV